MVYVENLGHLDHVFAIEVNNGKCILLQSWVSVFSLSAWLSDEFVGAEKLGKLVTKPLCVPKWAPKWEEVLLISPCCH